MKTPTTKKLAKKIQCAAVDYKPIGTDEVFYQIPKYPDIFISQYAQIIQVYKDNRAIIRKTFYIASTGYTSITLTNAWGKRKNWGLHNLVAKAWLEKPSFQIEGEPLDAHHKIKVKNNLKMQSIDINFASNLEYVYRRYHKLIDATRSIKVSTYNGSWKSVKSVEDIAKYYNIELQSLYERLIDKPSYKVDNLEYYEIDERRTIEIRKYKSKKRQKK